MDYEWLNMKRKKNISEMDSMLDNQSINYKGSVENLLRQGTQQEKASSINIKDESIEAFSFKSMPMNTKPILRKMTVITKRDDLTAQNMILEADEDFTPR